MHWITNLTIGLKSLFIFGQIFAGMGVTFPPRYRDAIQRFRPDPIHFQNHAHKLRPF